MMTVQESAYVVNELSAVRLPLLVRFRLRRIRRQRRTGLLLYGMIRTAARSNSNWAPGISVREGGRKGRLLCMCSHISKFPKWAPLEPGAHDLHFVAARRETASSFDKSFVLEDGDVLVAMCAPIETKLILTRRRQADWWYLGILSTSNEADPSHIKWS
jgi:hypothetical protein